MADDTIIELVNKAFAAARSGDLAPASALQDIGPALIPAIAPYLKDGNEDVRRQTVTLLGLTGNADAAPHLALALGDPSADISRRAADALYNMGGAAVQTPSAVEAIRDFVVKGDGAAGPILLLGYKPGSQSVASLNEVRQGRSGENAKVDHASPGAPVPLIADVALTRLNDRDAKSRLVTAIGEGDLDTLIFLLHILRDIDEEDVLRALADTALRDTRTVEGDVPSHADVDTRLADVAAARFTARFGLSTGIGDQATRPLTDAELDVVRAALAKRLAN